MFKRLRARVKGWKTYVFNGVIGSAAGIGLFLEELKELDLTPWLGSYAAKVIVLIAVAGIILRLYTDGPAAGRGRRRRRRDEPSGFELLDDEDEDGTERSHARARARRRESRRLAG